MKANLLALGLFGLAGASAVLPRAEDKGYEPEKKYDSYEPEKKYDSYEPEKKYDSYEPEKKYDSYEPEKKYDSYKPDDKYNSYKPDDKYNSYKPDDKYNSYKPDDKYDSYKPDDKYDSYKPDDKYDSYKPDDKYDSYKPDDKYDSYKPDDKYDSYKPGKPEYKSYPTKGSKHGKKPYKDEYPVNDEYADEKDYEDGYDYKNQKGYESTWKPKSKSPEFFNLRVDEKCDVGQAPEDCIFNGYAIRLEGGIFIATPYNKWWDPKLPTFFVDDDTQLYTVSKDPLQVYIDGITGALKYTKIGWLPPNAIAISFYHTGNNPLGLVDPSPSYLSWPSTIGGSFFGQPWTLCPLGTTQQYQVFINGENFGIGGPAGVTKDYGVCAARNLAAVNANPWKQESSPAPYYPPQPYPGYPGAGDY